VPPIPRTNENQAARRALARIADGIADPATRPQHGQVAAFLDNIFQGVQNLPQDAQADFHALFDNLTDAELQMLANLQTTMKGLHGRGYDLLADKFNPTLAKF
jgi:Skp family chaperone for outer membrane proteins